MGIGPLTQWRTGLVSGGLNGIFILALLPELEGGKLQINVVLKCENIRYSIVYFIVMVAKENHNLF